MVESKPKDGKNGINGAGFPSIQLQKDILTVAGQWHEITNGTLNLIQSGIVLMKCVFSTAPKGGTIFYGNLESKFIWTNGLLNDTKTQDLETTSLGYWYPTNDIIQFRLRHTQNIGQGSKGVILEMKSTESLSSPCTFNFTFTTIQ